MLCVHYYSYDCQERLYVLLLDLLLLFAYKGEHLQPASRGARAWGGGLLGDQMPHIAVEGAADERDPTPHGVHGGDRVPEDHPGDQYRDSHLEIAGYIEGHRCR